MSDELKQIKNEIIALDDWKRDFVRAFNNSPIEARVAMLGDAVNQLLGARLDDLSQRAKDLTPTT